MTQFSQRTIRQKVSCSGIGLHSGAPVHMTMYPAPADCGVTFVRTDLERPVAIEAKSANVVDTSLATTLGKDGARVSTVEHLLSALCGMGIDNLRVELDGPELPIMDGSAGPFTFLLREAGIEVQNKLKRFLVIRKPVVVQDGDKEARFTPASQLSISCTVDFRHPLISDQSLKFDFSDRTFFREISRARTFGFLKDVEALKRAGLARGGSLENAIVVDEFSILNPDGLRFPDEFVRHKVLDALGDLFLCGMPVIGQLSIRKSGHALHHKLVSKILADPSCYEVVAARKKDFERLDLRVPVLGLAAEGQMA